MSSLKARKASTLRFEHLQRADIKNYYEMKRFVDEREILCRDHMRSMFLINKEIQELQKTMMGINPMISGYCHEAYAAHLRSVSIAFSTCKELKTENTCGNIDFSVESGDSVKSKRMFSQKHECLGDETSDDRAKDLLEVKQHALTLETSKKCSPNTCISPHKDLKNEKDYLKASLSNFELSSRKCNEKDDKSDGCPQKTLPTSPSYIAKTDLKNSSLTPRHFILHRRAKQAHQRRQNVTLHKSPAPGMRNALHEQNCYYMGIQQQDQDSKTLSRYLQNKDGMDKGRSHISKAAIKHSLDLLIKECNRSKNADIMNNNKKRDLQEKVSNFVSELSEFNRDM